MANIPSSYGHLHLVRGAYKVPVGFETEIKAGSPPQPVSVFNQKLAVMRLVDCFSSSTPASLYDLHVSSFSGDPELLPVPRRASLHSGLRLEIMLTLYYLLELPYTP